MLHVLIEHMGSLMTVINDSADDTYRFNNTWRCLNYFNYIVAT